MHNNTNEEQLPIHTLPSLPPPTIKSSIYAVITNSYLNILLLVLPIAIISEYVHWSDAAVFFLNFIALIPLAKILGFCTEEISLYTNATLGALLNATFGNAIELILSIIALQKGLIRVVQASLLGSIFSNLLLVMGLSFLLGGFYYKELKFNVTAAQTGASLLAMVCFSLIIPAAFDTVIVGNPESMNLILKLSRATALILIVLYLLYIFFQLSTHKSLFENEGAELEEEEPVTTFYSAIGMLLLTTAVIALCAEYLVGSIEGLSKEWGLTETFVGLILLPIVGNAAEHLTAVTCAMKNKMDLSIGIGLGSSMQIALFVTPVCVIVGWIINQPMTLDFSIFETTILFVSIYVVNSLISDGNTNWLEGAMLLAAYFIVAIAFFLLP